MILEGFLQADLDAYNPGDCVGHGDQNRARLTEGLKDRYRRERVYGLVMHVLCPPVLANA